MRHAGEGRLGLWGPVLWWWSGSVMPVQHHYLHTEKVEEHMMGGKVSVFGFRHGKWNVRKAICDLVSRQERGGPGTTEMQLSWRSTGLPDLPLAIHDQVRLRDSPEVFTNLHSATAHKALSSLCKELNSDSNHSVPSPAQHHTKPIKCCPSVSIGFFSCNLIKCPKISWVL